MNILAKHFLKASLTFFVICGCALIIMILYMNAKQPSVENLEDVKLQVPLRIYTKDHKLIGEYGQKRRTPISIADVPEPLKLAILATEDRRFYEHSGVDIRGLLRASVHLITRGTKEQGASTITMQVARNFYLTRKKTFSRKLNEILLALKIEKELTKDQILELYLNKIYFGKRAYGVEAAARVYYGKSVGELNVAQMAMIAGLPQAPSAINPLNNSEAALKRRTHVLKRMLHYGFITEQTFSEAVNQPITAQYHGRKIEAHAPYVAETVRQALVDEYGQDIYTHGYEVTTTIDSALQKSADNALKKGLLAYDKRHGYRGPSGHIDLSDKVEPINWATLLDPYPRFTRLLPVVVTEIDDTGFKGHFAQGQKISVSFETMKWARPQIDGRYLGRRPQKPADVVTLGDVVYVEPKQQAWAFSQIPQASGALVSVKPDDGAILNMTGGFDFDLSHFNRAMQAYRQPGSNFKPIIYSAALEHGFTAASIINDAPVVFEDTTLESVWRPQNASQKFYGPTRLRVGLTKSRNLVSIRLLQALGISKAKDVIERFGYERTRLPKGLSLALGTITTTPLEMAQAYAVFANGGHKVDPYLIDKITDMDDNIVFQATPPTVCRTCGDLLSDPFNQTYEPIPQNEAISILSPQTAYIMHSMLQDAIQTGTGRRAKSLGRQDIAGKTGTTNQQMDAWYSGYNPNIVTTVWVGFDEPKSLREYGAQAALPIWIDHMDSALKGRPEINLPEPPGIVTVRIDPETGLLASPTSKKTIFEVFKEANVPETSVPSVNEEPAVAITPSSDSDVESLF